MKSCLRLGLLAAASLSSGATSAPLEVEFAPQWAGLPLVFDAEPTPDRPSVTRLDFLLSEIAVRDAQGAWLELSDGYAVIKARDGRLRVRLVEAPAQVTALRFSVGLAPAANARDPAAVAPGHPLHPAVNGLHWGMGGYVFLACEGHWLGPGGERRGFSWHLAGPELPVHVEVAFPAGGTPARVTLDAAMLFRGVTLSEATQSTHSRPGDPLAEVLRRNVAAAFTSVEGTWNVRGSQGPTPASGARMEGRNTQVSDTLGRTPAIPSHSTPYRFTYPAHFPKPDLPLDNPLTEEGVELGRLLYFDRRLSGNGRQSCATCHRPELAFIDPAGRVSRGADGQLGTRNSQSLTNLAWSHTFFWDGRAATLREQVLQPIENPVEMNARLPDVLNLLRGEPAYRRHFEAAFGRGEIDAPKLARALEQFLLTFVAGDTKLDRTLRGGEQLNAEEQRGFELFHTEYDPRRGQFGADCFHCHGGPMFRSQTFANNGLEAVPKDWGRALVTGKPADRGKFAVPSLRNVARTAPYMHDGRFGTLEEVVAHYATGVQRSATLDPNLAKHPAGGIPLSAEDQRALVAFLKTLTDDTRPPRPPMPLPRRVGEPPGPPPRGAFARVTDRLFGPPDPPPPPQAREFRPPPPPR